MNVSILKLFSVMFLQVKNIGQNMLLSNRMIVKSITSLMDLKIGDCFNFLHPSRE